MRVDQTMAAGTARQARRARRAGTGFTVAEAEAGTASTEELGAAQPAAGSLPLAALQAAASGPAGGTASQDRVAAGQGRALLGALAGLQLAGLEGDAVTARRTLADLARALPRAADPGLDGVLRAIAQRAAVELARAGGE